VEAEVGNVRKTFTWELRNRLPEGVVDKERFLMCIAKLFQTIYTLFGN
jgi:hypothetical protein